MLNAEERNSIEIEIEASTTIPISSNSSEKPGVGDGNGLKNIKTTRVQPSKKGSTAVPKTQKSLSQSLAFPSRGTGGNGLKKSVDSKPSKTNARNARTNGEADAEASKETVASHLSRPNRRASTGISSVNANPTARRATLGFDQSKLGQQQQSDHLLYEQGTGQQQLDDVDLCSMLMNDNNNNAEQKLHNIVTQRQELLQMEVQLRAHFIATSQIIPMHNKINDHANAASQLKVDTKVRGASMQLDA